MAVQPAKSPLATSWLCQNLQEKDQRSSDVYRLMELMLRKPGQPGPHGGAGSTLPTVYL